MADELISRAEAASLLGVSPEYVRKLLSRYGITEQRGYSREAVSALPCRRVGQGRRTDLSSSTPTDKEH